MRSKAKPRNESACPEQMDQDKPSEAPAALDSDVSDASEEPDDASELEEPDFIDTDDARWDVFLLDDDEGDPLPGYGDFWMPD
jgi:hypothetical protein